MMLLRNLHARAGALQSDSPCPVARGCWWLLRRTGALDNKSLILLIFAKAYQ
jgi:hypothetical protein